MSYPRVKWGANHDAWIHNILNSTDPISRTIAEKFVTETDEELIMRSKDRNFGFFIEKLPYGGLPDCYKDKNTGSVKCNVVELLTL